MPLSTVLCCIAFTLFISDSFWLQDRIHSLHNDAFALKRSLDGVWLAKILLPILLAVSLLFFSFLKTHFAGINREQWERTYCLVTVLAAISLALRFWQCPMAQDDSYIDYRYVQHWLAGQFDYNAGEHIMGFTSHLHLITLWAICKIFHTNIIDLASYYLNCAVDTINAIFLFFLVRKVYGGARPAFVAALCYAVSTYNCSQVISGKETALVNLVILLTLWAMKTGRLALLPYGANALFLFRPEGIFACLIILGTAIKTKGKAACKTMIVPCAITCVWYGFLLIYFGSIMPHGMIAKHKVLIPGDFFSVFMGCVNLTGNVMSNSAFFSFVPGLDRWPFLPATVLIFIYAYWRLREPCWALYRNIALAQLILLMVIQSRVFSWYFCWFALLIPIAMAQLIADATGTPGGKKLPLILLRTAICLLLFFYLRTGFFFAPYAWLPYLERGVVYREAALFLQNKTKGKDIVAASDVGILGYYYSGPILDLMGLISNESLKYYPIAGNDGIVYLIPPKAVAEFKPKYLMAPFSHVYGMLSVDPDFQSHYTLLKSWANPAMTDGIVSIWERDQATDAEPKGHADGHATEQLKEQPN
jgi:hypothetical protein